MSIRNRDSFRLSTSKSVYEDFFSEDIAEQGLVNGTLFKGILRVTAQKRNIAFVTVDKAKIDVCIDNENLRNRSVNGDTVIIQLLPVSEWTTPLKSSSLTNIVEGINPQSFISDKEINHKLWKPKGNISLITPVVVEISDPLKIIHPIDELVQRTTLQPRAKVVYVYPRSKAVLLVGSLDGSNNNIQIGCKLPKSAPYVFFRPSDNKYPSFIINRLDIPEAYVNDPFNVQKQIFLAELSPVWPTDSKMPFGCNVRSIGEVGSIQAETEALLLEHGIRHDYFENEVVAPLQKLLGSSVSIDTSSREVNWNIPADEIAKRRDLRHYRIFTIDPYNAKDLDDALHITPLGNNIYEIGVHIADVSYFIPENTPLDLEARKRATSVYLVQKVIPMLPPILCEQLCSLNPNVDRLAFSVIWRMNADGTLTDDEPWFGRTVIRCCAKLDYATAQRMIDGIIPSEGSQNNINEYLAKINEDIWEVARRPVMTSSFAFSHALWDIAKDVCVFNSIAIQRRITRLENGAIALNQPKLTFQLDDHGNPKEVETYNIRESNKLVEEYMLLANYLVAQQLAQKASRAAFLRRHPAPNSSGLEELEKLAATIGIIIDSTTAESLQRSLSELTSTNNELITQAVTCLMVKPMKPAEYFVVDDIRNPDYWNHYALAIPYYTHFTSPIRRYADIEVHRLLLLTLPIQTQPESPVLSPTKHSDKNFKENREIVSEDRIKILSANAMNCNDMKLAAKNAQTRSSEVFFAIYLQNNPVETEAVVLGIGPKTFTIYTPQFGLQSKLFVDEMIGVSHSFNDETKELTLTRRSNTNSSSNSNDKGKARRGRGGSVTASPSTTGSPKPSSEHNQSSILRFKSLTITIMSTIIVRISTRTTPPPIALQFSLVGPTGNTMEQSPNGSFIESPSKPAAPSSLQKDLEEEKSLLVFEAEGVERVTSTDNTSSLNSYLDTDESYVVEKEKTSPEAVVIPPSVSSPAAKVMKHNFIPPPPPTRTVVSPPISTTSTSSESIPPPPPPPPIPSTTTGNTSKVNTNHNVTLEAEEIEKVKEIDVTTSNTATKVDIADRNILDIIPIKKSEPVKLTVLIDDNNAKFDDNNDIAPKAKNNVIEDLTASMTILTDTLKSITIEDTAGELTGTTVTKQALKDSDLDHVPVLQVAVGSSSTTSPRTSPKIPTKSSVIATSKITAATDNKKITATSKALKKIAPSAPAPTFSPLKPLHSNSFPDDLIKKHQSPNHTTGNTISSRLSRSSSSGHKSPIAVESTVNGSIHTTENIDTEIVAVNIVTNNEKTEESVTTTILNSDTTISTGQSDLPSSVSPNNSNDKDDDKDEVMEKKTVAAEPPTSNNITSTTTTTTTTTLPSPLDKQSVAPKTSNHLPAASTKSTAKSAKSKDSTSKSIPGTGTVTASTTGNNTKVSAAGNTTNKATTVTASKTSAASRRMTLGGSISSKSVITTPAPAPAPVVTFSNPLTVDSISPVEVELVVPPPPLAAPAPAVVVTNGTKLSIKPKHIPVVAGEKGSGGKKPLPTTSLEASSDSSKLKPKSTVTSANATASKTTLPKSTYSYATASATGIRKSILNHPLDTKSETGEREKAAVRRPAPLLKTRTKSEAALLTLVSTSTSDSTSLGRKSLLSSNQRVTQKADTTKNTNSDTAKEKVGSTKPAATTSKSLPKSNSSQADIKETGKAPKAYINTSNTGKSEAINGADPPDTSSKLKQKPIPVTVPSSTSKHTSKSIDKTAESTKNTTSAVTTSIQNIVLNKPNTTTSTTAINPVSELVDSLASSSLASSPPTPTPAAKAVPISEKDVNSIAELKRNNKKVTDKKPVSSTYALSSKKLSVAAATTTTATSDVPSSKSTYLKSSSSRKSLAASLDTKSEDGGRSVGGMKPARKSLAPNISAASKAVTSSVPSTTTAPSRSLSTGRLANPPGPPSANTTIKSTNNSHATRTNPKINPDTLRKLETKSEPDTSINIKQKPRNATSTSSTSKSNPSNKAVASRDNK